jgi:uncharacterized protein (DUF1778 family)
MRTISKKGRPRAGREADWSPAEMERVAMAEAHAKSRKVISIRIPLGTRVLIDQAAEATGKTRTDFILEAAATMAQDVVLDRRLFRVSDRDFNRLMAIMDAPSAPSPDLVKLMKKKAPWEK